MRSATRSRVCWSRRKRSSNKTDAQAPTLVSAAIAAWTEYFAERRLSCAAAARRRLKLTAIGVEEGHEGQVRTAGASVLRARRSAGRRRASRPRPRSARAGSTSSRPGSTTRRRTGGAQTHAAGGVVRRSAVQPVSARSTPIRWLADALRARYPAALIDEFQDTDPLQFAIFRPHLRAGRAAVSGRRSEAGDLQFPRGRSAYVSDGARGGVGALYARGQPAFDGADHRCLQPAVRGESCGVRARRTRLSAGARRPSGASAVHRQHADAAIPIGRLPRLDVAARRSLR